MEQHDSVEFIEIRKAKRRRKVKSLMPYVVYAALKNALYVCLFVGRQ